MTTNGRARRTAREISRDPNPDTRYIPPSYVRAITALLKARGWHGEEGGWVYRPGDTPPTPPFNQGWWATAATLFWQGWIEVEASDSVVTARWKEKP